MPDTETILVLGRGTNVDFSIDDSVPFELAERRLREYLSECRGLYSKGTVTVNVGRRILSTDQMASIKSILGQETGLTVRRYWCPPEVLSRALAGPESRRALPSPLARIARDHLDAQVEPPAFPETGTLNGCQDRVETELVWPALPCETAPPEGQQLSMTLPGLDDGQDIGSHQQGAVEYLPMPKKSAEEIRATIAREWTRPIPGVVAGAEESLSDNSREENAASPTSSTRLESGEAYLEPAHSVFQRERARGSEALIIKNTCRSGEVVRYQGDIVVFGDVNPGAEIVAAGDIVVLGALRGMARAGADGNLKATILALNLESHRLQIGSYAGERPRGAKKGRGIGKAVTPQIAYLRRGSIFVAPYERRCEEYRGGVPYEG